MERFILKARPLSTPQERHSKVTDFQSVRLRRTASGVTINQRRNLEKLEHQLRYLDSLEKAQDFALRLRAEKQWNPSYGNGRVLKNQIRRNEKRISAQRQRIEELIQEAAGVPHAG